MRTKPRYDIVGFCKPLRRQADLLDADINLIIDGIHRVDAAIARGAKAGQALQLVAARHGRVVAARMDHATDAAWRSAERRIHCSGADRIVKAYVAMRLGKATLSQAVPELVDGFEKKKSL